MDELTQLNSGDHVISPEFGRGRVEYDKGETVLVRFEDSIQECAKTTLQYVFTPLQVIGQSIWDEPSKVITRSQAAAILSINDAWGVFAQSRIALLPHQLWVCKQVLEQWPTRWMVADDVGLGKTIEAALILSALLSRGIVERALILCPASLVEQWQVRLRTMFDIRFARYTSEADTPQADFWHTHNQVIASLHTLRADYRDRHQRLLESEPWDIVIVDEAHHLNADEKSGPTLGFQLAEKLERNQRVKSMVFFTGTPHRGKDYGFFSLLSLLRPDLFDPQNNLEDQLDHLRYVMIRNNKQNVTDLSGERIFRAPIVSSETFSYSVAEEEFYGKLTDFILTGKTYASSLASQQGRAVMLVLITMQKLASSSVAAIRRALKGRLGRIVQGKAELKELDAAIQRYRESEATGDNDEISRLEETIAMISAELRLMDNEALWLEELLAAANTVGEETKIKRIISIVQSRYPDRSILFFTEYKATQSLLMSALMQTFGEEYVTFVNGDDRAEEVVDSKGQVRTVYERRESAVDRFNSGAVRFLVSTEAAGEGVDLQENCHTLIHVDLPWNPMRLHQRAGRLNRYGQAKQVEILSLRNPGTVEARIWEKLDAKIERIMLSLSQVMAEPEDLRELVLGMTSPSIIRDLFSEAHSIPPKAFDDWFDQKTASFGGKDVVDTVNNLIGNSARFDFQQMSDRLPRVDLPDLEPFFLAMLAHNGRRVQRSDATFGFITPEAWLTEPAVRPRYGGMVFDRHHRGPNAAQHVLGIGHRAVMHALQQAQGFTDSVTTLPQSVLKQPIFVFRIRDRLTGIGGAVQTVVVGVEVNPLDTQPGRVLQDWELLLRLNELSGISGVRRAGPADAPPDSEVVMRLYTQAEVLAQQQIQDLELPFQIPDVELLAIFWSLVEEQT